MTEDPLSGDHQSSVDRDEVARFAALGDAWWDPDGAFRQLHELNPTRLRYIRDRLAAHFERDIADQRPFAGLRLLDIGCGGGLVSEPMARLGADVFGIDAAADSMATGTGTRRRFRPSAARSRATSAAVETSSPSRTK